MSPRTGRPPSDDPRSTTVETRMSKKELEKLEYCSKVMGKSKSEVIREGVELIFASLCKE